MHEINMFARESPLSLEGFEGSGADWLDSLKPHVNHDNTVVTSPHKVYGPENNDLVLQLRKRNVNKVYLAGMSANLCVESHLRELLEQGFEVVVVSDATAGADHPELGDGYQCRHDQLRFYRKRRYQDRTRCERDLRRFLAITGSQSPLTRFSG